MIYIINCFCLCDWRQKTIYTSGVNTLNVFSICWPVLKKFILVKQCSICHIDICLINVKLVNVNKFLTCVTIEKINMASFFIKALF